VTTSKGSRAAGFLGDLTHLRKITRVTARAGKRIPLSDGLGRALKTIEYAGQSGRKVIFIGNGGSAAIASHMAIDYWKNGGIRAIAFNDASLLTCIGNDFGFERLFAEPVRRFAESGDVLVAVSSGGRSKNILNGVSAAREKKCRVITYSGFDDTNPLRSLGDLNFHVPSHSYAYVEVSHLSLIHSLLEERMLLRKSPGASPLTVRG